MNDSTPSHGEAKQKRRRSLEATVRAPSAGRVGTVYVPVPPLHSHHSTSSRRSRARSVSGTAPAREVAGYGTMQPYRSMSVPVLSSHAVYFSKRAHKQLSVAQQSARLVEKAKKNFFHGSFTSSHGSVFTVPNRAQQMATSVPSRAASLVGRRSAPRSAFTVKHNASTKTPIQLQTAPRASAMKKPGNLSMIVNTATQTAFDDDLFGHINIMPRARSADAAVMGGWESIMEDTETERPRLKGTGGSHVSGHKKSGEVRMTFPESSPDLIALEQMREHSAKRTERPPLSPTTIARAAHVLRKFEERKVRMPNNSFNNAKEVAVDGRLMPVPVKTPLVLTKRLDENMRRVHISSVVDEDDSYEDSEVGTGSSEEEQDNISWCSATMDLLYLAAPAAVTICFTFCMSVIPLAFVGSYLGERELTGASVGYFITCILILYPMIGLTFAMDTLCSHEYGRDPLSPEMGLVLQRGILINIFFLIPLCSILYLLHAILVPIYGVNVANVAHDFLVYSPFFILPDMLLIAFGKFLNNQMQPQIPMIGLTAGVIITPFLQYQLTPMGVRYTMVGMAITAWFQLAIIIVITLFKPETRMTLGTWRLKEALYWADVKEYMKLAIPSAIFVAAEASSFDLTVLLCAQFGEKDGAAWSGIMNSLFIFASFSGGLSASACANIGRCIGADWPVSAKRYVILSIAFAFFLGIVDSVILVGGFNFLMSLFGTSGKTLSLAREVLFLLPFLHICDAVQFTFQGIFSGLGKNHLGAVILLTSLWGIGVPLCVILGHFLGYKMFGVCAGITIGLCIEAPVMVLVASTMNYHEICDNFMEEDDEEDEEEEDEESELDEEYDEEYVENVLRRSGIPSSNTEFDGELSEHYKRLLPPKQRRKRRPVMYATEESDDEPRNTS